MAHRSLLSLLGVLGIASAALTAGCEAKHVGLQTVSSTTAANEFAVSPAVAPVGERMLDTSTAAVPAPAPVMTANVRKVTKPGSDENLPSWVPVTGRLTVVEAPDLAENLGLVPKGSTKNAQTRISVANLLAQNGTAPAPAGATATAAAPAAPVGGGVVRSATWLASNGRIRHGRR